MPGMELGSLDLPLRFKLVNAAPVALLVLITGGLVLAGAPNQSPSVKTLLANAHTYGWTGAAVSVAVIVIVALVVEPLEVASIRALEGYWEPTGLLRGLAAAGVWLQRRRRSRLEFLGSQPHTPPDLATWAATALMEQFPREERLLPTSLGNRLRAFEDRAGLGYGLDAVTWWPRLHLTLPESVLATVNGYRNQLDVAARFTFAFTLAGPAATGLLIRHPPWLLLPAALLLLAFFAYRAALGAAVNYGLSFTAAIDVYRLRLLQQMRVEMPRDTNAERKINDERGLLWGGDATANVTYSTTDSDHTITLH
jgi:hypothetical protein